MTSRLNSLFLLSASCIVAASLTACGGGSGATASETAAIATSSSSSGGTQSGATSASGTQTSSTGATSTQTSSSNTLSSTSAASVAFSYASGFSGAGSNISISGDASVNGSVLELTSTSIGAHQAGGAWYKTQQNIQSFTTDFTFQVDPAAYGFTFCIQNSNATTNPTPSYGGIWYGIYAAADANELGYGAYSTQTGTAIGNSVAIKFDLTSANGNAYLGSNPGSTGLFIDGGPVAEVGFLPENDLATSGVNLHSGDTMSAHVVYDGSTLTMVLTDTVTGAQARMSWPVDIPAVVGGNTAYVGFTGGTVPAANQDVLTWSFWQGYGTKLAAPTFSVASGTYASTQSVALSAASGATIYYTTDGQPPSTSSSVYSGPLLISSSESVQAIAIENGYADSAVVSSTYQIGTTPIINFPGGFSDSANQVALNGSALRSGSSIQLTDTANALESASAWYTTAVNVRSFTTNFTVQLSNATANGFTFTIQNPGAPSAGSGALWASGGPYAVARNAADLGYGGLLNSVAVKFDLSTGSGNTTGLYTNGATPDTSSIDMSSSGVSLHSGHPLSVAMTYDGTTLSMTVTDTTTNATFSHSWNIDIPGTVGGDTAYVGFTAGTGWTMALQKVLYWTYSN